MRCLSAPARSTPGVPLQHAFVQKLQWGPVFSAPPASISCIHHIHGDVCVQYITLMGTRVCVFLFVKAPHIGAELIKSVY